MEAVFNTQPQAIDPDCLAGTFCLGLPPTIFYLDSKVERVNDEVYKVCIDCPSGLTVLKKLF